jgi:Uma2 family endonuclease
MTGVALRLADTPLTDRQLMRLSAANPDLRLERTAAGELVVMGPTGSDMGRRNQSLGAQLWAWNHATGLGVVFDSSTGFRLPNGAVRSPDAAWVARARWEALTDAERTGYAPLCPDFVVELVSSEGDLGPTADKMREYLANGAALGWLLDPLSGRVQVHRPGRAVELLDRPTCMEGEALLPGFRLDLSDIL